MCTRFTEEDAMNTVLIADDELTIRQGLKCIINWEALGFSITGEVSNGEEALSFILNKQPDLVLMDIRIPNYLVLMSLRQHAKRGIRGKSSFSVALLILNMRRQPFNTVLTII